MARIKSRKLNAADLTAYVKWLQTPSLQHTVGIGNGKARGPSDDMYVIPFNITLPPNTYATSKGLASAKSAIENLVTGHVTFTLPAGDFGVPLKKYSAARVSRRTGISKGQPKPSHILSDRTYTPYGGTSYSLPFGKNTTQSTASEVDVFEQVVKPIFAPGGVKPAGEELTLIKEKFVPQ